MKKVLTLIAFSILFFQQAMASPTIPVYKGHGVIILAFQQGSGSAVTKEQMDKELENIKSRQDITLQTVSEMFRNALWVFGLLGLIITLFSFFQTFQDSRVIKLLKEQVKEGKEITSSYQKNINSITGLVGSLREVFEFQAKAQKIMEEVIALKRESEASQKHWDDEIADLNKSAVQLSLLSRRNSYNQTAFQRSTREFRDEYKNITSSTDTKDKLNANCYYIIALDYRILNDYEESLSHFKMAITLAGAHKQGPTDALALYPLLPEGKSLTTWLTKLQNVCAYHSAIINYNLGQYDEALKSFELALTYDPSDYKSLTYIPEAMYLGRLATFKKIEATFEEVIKKITDLKPRETQNFAETREQLLAQAYMKLGNCYLGESNDEDFRRYKNLSTAEKHFRKALDLDPQSNIAKFSLAQVLFMRDREKTLGGFSNGVHRELFLDVFQKLKSQLYRITEAKILMMYYYILAICCAYGKIESEIPQLYIMRIHEIRPNLPSHPDLRVFSPLTKNDLIVDDFIREVEQFNSKIADATAKSQVGDGRHSLVR